MDAIEPFIIRNYLLFFLLPAWVAVGTLDWWTVDRACYRARKDRPQQERANDGNFYAGGDFSFTGHW